MAINKSEAIIQACEECVQNGTMTERELRRIKFVRAMRPIKFHRESERLVNAATDNYGFDPDNLRALLDILIEYLPLILDLLLPLFTSDDR